MQNLSAPQVFIQVSEGTFQGTQIFPSRSKLAVLGEAPMRDVFTHLLRGILGPANTTGVVAPGTNFSQFEE